MLSFFPWPSVILRQKERDRASSGSKGGAGPDVLLEGALGRARVGAGACRQRWADVVSLLSICLCQQDLYEEQRFLVTMRSCRAEGELVQQYSLKNSVFGPAFFSHTNVIRIILLCFSCFIPSLLSSYFFCEQLLV